MVLRTQYEFLFIGRDEGSFVENYAYDLGEVSDDGGKIFIDIEIQNNPAEAEVIGETIFDTVRKAFFADLEKGPYERFEDALKSVNRILNQIRDEKISKYIGNLHVIIAAVIGNNLYLTQCGDSEAYLVRRRYCSTISEGLADESSKDFFTNIATGVMENGDFVLLSSTRLLRYMTKTDLAKIAAAKNLVVILGELKDFLSAEVLGKIGFIGIDVLEAKPEFNEKEKGKVMAHLQKEQEFEHGGIKERKVTKVTFTNISKKVSGFLGAVKSQLQSFQNQFAKGRSSKGSGMRFANFDLRNWSKDKILGALILAVILLTVGVWWLRSRAEEQDKINHYSAVLNEVREEISSAETTAQYNPTQAADMLTDAEQKAKDVYNSRYSHAKANELLTAIQNARDKLDGVTHVQPKVLVDLALKRSNVSALGLLALKENLYAFEYNALYPILLDKLQDPLTIDDTETVIAGSAFEDKNSLLFFTKNGRVLEYQDNHFGSVPSSEGTYHKGVAVKAYGSKFYVLDSAANQIWKYTRRRDKFDVAEAYNVDADLKKGISIAIDGNIYVLNSDGTLLKLLSGSKQNLTIKRSPAKALLNPTKVYTTLDMPQLYILEPAQHRVLMYYKDDKTGGLTYSAQYIFDDLNDIRDFYVDKEGKNMYLLDQSKVYKVALGV